MANTKQVTQLEQINASMATEYLERVAPNRHMRPQVAMRYAQDMKAGRWIHNHQGIAFDRDGMLIDGQHRLAAIIMADACIPMFVTRGVDRRAMEVIDSGATRTLADAGILSGRVGFNHRMGAVIRGAILSPGFTWRSCSRSLVFAFLDMFRRETAMVMSWFPKCCRRDGTWNPRATVISAFLRALLANQDQERLRVGAQIVVTGQTPDGSEPGDRTMVVMRSLFTVGTAQVLHDRSRGDYLRAQAGLRAFLAGQDLKLVRPVDLDIFPLPEKWMNLQRKEAITDADIEALEDLEPTSE